MKKIFRPLTILKILIPAMLFFSCSNFTESGDFKTKFDKEVSFANAPEIQVKVFSKKADTLPSGISQRKHGEEFSVYCNPFPDFQFVRWQVKNLSTGKFYSEEELKNIATFENPEDSETMCTIVVPENEIQIEPLCVERPHVLSEYPVYSNTGSYRDACIQLMFDQTIAEGSIYFSSDELKELGLESSAGFYTKSNEPSSGDYFLCGNPTSNLTIDTVTYESKVFGYRKGGDIYFKNINILNNLTKENLLKYYDCPSIDNLYLRIPTKKGTSPESGTQVEVDISPDIFYIAENADVKLNNVKKWIYNVNDKTDTVPPEVVVCNVYTSDGTTLSTVEPESSALDYTSLDKISKLKNGKIKIYARILDSDSGPNSNFTITLEQIYNSNYIKLNPKITFPNQTVMFTNPSTTSCSLGTETNPSEISLNNIPQGVSRLTVTFKDMNDNETKKIYYFAIDKTPPALGTGFKQSDSTKNSITVSWTNPSVADFKETIVKYRVANSNAEYKTITVPRTSSTCTISDLTAGTSYEIAFEFVDIFGNSNQTSSKLFVYTRPNDVTNLKVTATTTASETLSWSKPSSGSATGYKIYYKLSSNSSYTYYTYTTGTSYTVSGLSTGKQYDFMVRTYLGSTSWESSGTTITSQYTKPSNVSNLKVTATTTSSETLSWSSPSAGSVTGYRIYYKLSNSSSYTYYTYTTGTSYTVSGLSAGNLYDFKVTTYLGTTSNESTGTTTSHYTRPNGVTNIKVLNNITSATNMSLDISWTNPTSGNYAGTLFMLGTENDISKATYRGWEAPGVTSTNISVTPSTNYYVWVVTWTETSTSGSDINNDTRMSTTAVQAPILSSVSFKVEPASTKRIKISWTYPTSYASNYYTYIYYGTSNTDMGNGKAKYLDYWAPGMSARDSTYSIFSSGTTYYFWIVTAPSASNLHSLLTTNNTSAFINKLPYHESTGWLNATAPY